MGRARLIRSLDEADRIGPGDVDEVSELVAEGLLC